MKALSLPLKSLRRTVLLPAIVLALNLGLWPQNTPATSQTQTHPQQETPAAGGPQGDIGPMAIPTRKPEDEKPAPRPERIKNPEGMGDFSLRSNTQLVNVDVSVVTKDGQFIPGLKKENFRVYEDGVPQAVSNLAQTEAPITAAMLLEFASPHYMINQTDYSFIRDMLTAAYVFTGSLKPEDWVAVVSYDMYPTTVVDFTQDKRAVAGGLNSMRTPMHWETNMFDALYDTIDRMENIEGRKYIVLIASGYDSFSKLTFDKIMAKVKTTRNITIYAVGTGQASRIWRESHGYTDPISNLNFLQADNEMRTFANLTGGRAYFPRFTGEMPEIFRDIAQTIRNQYMITYKPSNTAQDGSYRKIKVELVADNGGPLVIQDQKGKKLKYQLIAREGYRAKQVVE